MDAETDVYPDIGRNHIRPKISTFPNDRLSSNVQYEKH